MISFLRHFLNNPTILTVPTANTDNKGKLFVTVFAFATACMTNTCSSKPGYAHLPAGKVLYRDSKVASTEFVPRNCTSCLRTNLLHRDSKVVAPWFVPRSRQHAKKLCHDCKNTCHTLLAP